MVRLVLNQKGISMIEILIVVVIVGLLATMGIPGYQQLKKNSYQQSGMAQLAAYHRAAKIMIGEFAYNPGNFVAIGFKLEGDYYYRIKAADGEDPPAYYPDQPDCVSTEDNTKCNQLCDLTVTPMECPWRELLSSYKDASPLPSPTISVDGMRFKAYAYSNDEENYLCTDEAGVYAGDCP